MFKEAIFALALLGFPAAGSYGQTAMGKPQFRAEAAMVLIPFTAVDSRERLIAGISVDSLRLFSDGKEQKIDFVSQEDGPASILFVVDISGSMKKPLTDAQEAIRKILRAAPAEDEFALVEFSDRPELTVAFTNRQDEIEDHIGRMAPAGHTSLADAIVLAADHMSKAARQPRKAIVVVSDGQDNYSRYTEREAIRLAVETDARIYGIELYPPSGEGAPPASFIELLARATGGRYLPTVRRGSIPDLADRIDVHHRYVLGFTAPPEHRDERAHQVELRPKTRLSTGRARLYWKE